MNGRAGARRDDTILRMAATRLDSGLETLLERYRALAAPCALATIVGTAGSTYRKAGARMLIEADGRITGLLSGGCLEEDLREHALAVLESKVAAIVEYDMRSSDDLIFGIGAGCEGAMRVLIEPAPSGGRAALALELAGRTTRAGGSAALLVGVEGERAALGTHVWTAAGSSPLSPELAAASATVVAAGAARTLRIPHGGIETEFWIQYLPPLPRVLVCGAGPDAEPLVTLLAMLGMVVTIVDHRPAYALAARFPRGRVVLADATALADAVDLDGFMAAVVMSHHLASDASYLRACAASSIPYVGLLGPRARRERLLSDLGGAADGLAARLRGPIGLDIGAVTPEAIALAIAAEVHAFASGRSGGALAPPARTS
jgi:xanthine/CO dehydrogenase XdhC/CoxF family maturation factor